MEPMSKVTTIKGNLFDAPEGSIIIHVCTTKGVWGYGIAKEFAKRFPKARDIYAQTCRQPGPSLTGKCLLIPAGSHVIGCLFTSKNYGQFVDSPARILTATRLAIAHLILQNEGKLPMHMCKINAGLFNVPWPKTKAILKDADVEFVVYDF